MAKTFLKAEYVRVQFGSVVMDMGLAKAPVGTPREPLQKFFCDDGGAPVPSGGDVSDPAVHDWDQFAENERRFNVKASFDEEKYTTKLNKESLSAQQLERAERISKEIQRQSSSNFHIREDRGQIPAGEVDDEEKAYSAVLGTGKYAAGCVKDNKFNKKMEATKQNGIGRGGRNADKEEMPQIEVSASAVAMERVAQRREKMQDRRYGDVRSSHKNSLDYLGVDSACMMDPDTHRELRKFRQEKMTRLAVQHMKSLVMTQTGTHVDV